MGRLVATRTITRIRLFAGGPARSPNGSVSGAPYLSISTTIREVLHPLMRGGSPNLSQRLMRLRVLLQFIAIVIIMLTVWAMGR